MAGASVQQSGCLCVCLCVRLLSFSSCPAQGVPQSGVGGRRGYTAAYDWQPHYTTCTEPVREEKTMISIDFNLGCVVNFRCTRLFMPLPH